MHKNLQNNNEPCHKKCVGYEVTFVKRKIVNCPCQIDGYPPMGIDLITLLWKYQYKKNCKYIYFNFLNINKLGI